MSDSLLELACEVKGTTHSTNYTCTSDIRYKKNITPIESALKSVLALRGVNYFWRADEYKEKNFRKEKQVGLIAQEVEKVIPEVVHTGTDGYKSLAYGKLTPFLVEAIKELKTESDANIAAFEKENASLKQDIASLKKENESLKKKLAKLDKMAGRILALEKAMRRRRRSWLQDRGIVFN